MRNTNYCHLLFIALIAAECLVLISISGPKREEPAKRDRGRISEMRTAADEVPVMKLNQQAQITILEARKLALEEEISELYDPPSRDSDSVRVSSDFIKNRRFGKSASPIGKATETRRLLQITEEEGNAIDIAKARALELVKAVEASLAHQEIGTDGKTVVVVDPRPDLIEPLMGTFKDDLVEALGESRADVLFTEIRASTFAHGGEHRMEINYGPMTLNVPSNGPQLYISFKHSDSDKHISPSVIAISEENTPKILDRFSHILGVETADELQDLFATPKEQ